MARRPPTAGVRRALANAAPTRQARARNMQPAAEGRHEIVRHTADRRPGCGRGLAGAVRSLRAQTAQSTEPIEVAKLPYIEIFSPTFFWNDEADFVRTGSTTCPKGRAITGGLSIQQGKASLRILESYPDGESWVMRVVNRQKPDTVQSLAGARLRAVPAAGGPQGLGADVPAIQAAARVGPVRAAVGSCRARPAARPARRARSSSPADSGSTRSTAGRRRRAWS